MIFWRDNYLQTRYLKGAKATIISFKNKNNNYLSLPLFLSLPFSLTGEEGVRTLFTGQREREREIEKDRERERERERERNRERERQKRERKIER